ncbi:MAG TPA: FUSC family protein [Lacunisphaera sp.]|nr:FUSC family protein [Lacunisphaera sp.]
MHATGGWTRIDDFLERRRLKPDLGRAVRATLGFMLPVLAARAWNLPLEISIAAITAQNIAMVDVRGSYPLRLGLLLAMTAVYVVAVGLGAFGAPSLMAALLVIALVTLLSGLWRHVFPDYGQSFAVTSVFLALLALALPGGAAAAGRHVLAGLAGGLFGVLVQVALWPFRAEHPLRRAVSDSWLALSDLLGALNPDLDLAPEARQLRVAAKEAELRAAIDHARGVLADPGGARGPLRPRLLELNMTAARLFTQAVALESAFGHLRERPDAAQLAANCGPVFTSLVNTSRTIAITVVSRQPSHLAATEVRMTRLASLLRATAGRLDPAEPDPALHQLVAILQQIATVLPDVRAALRATIARAGEQAAFSLELTDLRARALRPLASAMNLSWPPGVSLLRFVLRLALLQLLGVAVMKWAGWGRGYWLPLTMLIVLQPDYGATRARAVQRVLGTLAGVVLGSGLLWLQPPAPVALAAMTVTMFGFAFWLKRNYGVAVVFITLFVVLITETQERVTLGFTLERLGATVAGGVLALAAAYAFWPDWERRRFPSILAAALRANRAYLEKIAALLAEGGRFAGGVVLAKRAAESANAAAFASLQRMAAEPEHQQAGFEAAAALVNGNQRLTSALTGAAVQLGGGVVRHPALEKFAGLAAGCLEALVAAAEGSRPDAARFDHLRGQLDAIRFPSAPLAAEAGQARTEQAAYLQFARAATELDAMLLEAGAAATGDSAASRRPA